jgi:hypothetical protein
MNDPRTIDREVASPSKEAQAKTKPPKEGLDHGAQPSFSEPDYSSLPKSEWSPLP